MVENQVVVEQYGYESWRITFTGEHDLSTVPAIRRALDEVFGHGTNVLLDFSEATFIDSSVLGQLVNAQRRAEENGHERVVLAVPPASPAALVIDLTGMRKVLQIYDSREEAAEALLTPSPTR
jgi:anti-sigma B factor antagonist